MSDKEREHIAEQMRDILSQSRGLRGDYIGTVNRGPAIDARESTSRGGPFDSEAEFNEFRFDNMIFSTPL